MRYLDKTDAAILSIVQGNNALPRDELGSMVNLSPSACGHRIDRLRAEGVIKAEVAIVSPQALGRAMTMVMLVSLERGSADAVDKFKEALKVTPEVMMGYYVAADTDFMLVVTAKSIEDYDQFTRRFLFENPCVKRFKTMVVMDQVKSGFGFPIDLNDPIFNDTAVN